MRIMRLLPLSIALPVLASLVSITGASLVQAEYRIATVDINRVLNESSEAKTKRKDLDQKQADAKKRIEEKGKAIKAMEKKLKDGGASDTSKEAEEYRNEVRNLDRLVKDSEEDLKKDFLKFNKSVTEKALKIVTDYAKSNKIDLVLDKGEKAKGPILYGDASFDITDEVLNLMNQ
jgi:Skp family chaperone for outer membrane proteins